MHTATDQTRSHARTSLDYPWTYERIGQDCYPGLCGSNSCGNCRSHKIAEVSCRLYNVPLSTTTHISPKGKLRPVRCCTLCLALFHNWWTMVWWRTVVSEAILKFCLVVRMSVVRKQCGEYQFLGCFLHDGQFILDPSHASSRGRNLRVPGQPRDMIHQSYLPLLRNLGQITSFSLFFLGCADMRNPAIESISF
ncbi:hypothetical protein CBL_01139 [Carabus blaptoides fortunei]